MLYSQLHSAEGLLQEHVKHQHAHLRIILGPRIPRGHRDGLQLVHHILQHTTTLSIAAIVGLISSEWWLIKGLSHTLCRV